MVFYVFFREFFEVLGETFVNFSIFRLFFFFGENYGIWRY